MKDKINCKEIKPNFKDAMLPRKTRHRGVEVSQNSCHQTRHKGSYN